MRPDRRHRGPDALFERGVLLVFAASQEGAPGQFESGGGKELRWIRRAMRGAAETRSFGTARSPPAQRQPPGWIARQPGWIQVHPAHFRKTISAKRELSVAPGRRDQRFCRLGFLSASRAERSTRSRRSGTSCSRRSSPSSRSASSSSASRFFGVGQIIGSGLRSLDKKHSRVTAGLDYILPRFAHMATDVLSRAGIVPQQLAPVLYGAYDNGLTVNKFPACAGGEMAVLQNSTAVRPDPGMRHV